MSDAAYAWALFCVSVLISAILSWRISALERRVENMTRLVTGEDRRAERWSKIAPAPDARGR